MDEKDFKIEKLQGDSMKQIANRTQRLIEFWNKEYQIEIPKLGEVLVTKINPEDYARRIMTGKEEINIFEALARDFAIFEKDFSFVKHLNEEMSISHSQLLEHLPTVEEMDALIKIAQEKDEKDEAFFKSAKKSERLKVMQMLKTAALKLKGA
jgi:hypothetical protein